MKRWYMVMFVFLAGCFVAAGALTKDQIDDLKKKVKIGSISDDTFKDDSGIRFEKLTFYTYQDEDSADENTFYVKVTIELKGKKSKDTYFAQFARTQGAVDSEYTGEDNWQFVVAAGDLERPKVTAYVVQYGVIEDKKFIVLAEEMDKVDSLDELMKRSPTRLEQKPRILHQYNYRDTASDNEEVVQSMWQ